MPDKAEFLALVMEIRTRMEELIAVNTLVADGLVTDLEIIREAARTSNEFLNASLIGTNAIFQGDDHEKEVAAWTFDTLLDRET